MSDVDQEIEITLERGSRGLGFNIKGGTDVPYLEEDHGIFVTKIRPEGTAAEDGRLKEGDKITEINGHTLCNVCHSEAVNLFRNSGNVVKLKVIPGVEKKIKAARALKAEKPDSSGVPKYWKYVAIGIGVIVLTGLVYKNFGKLTSSVTRSHPHPHPQAHRM